MMKIAVLSDIHGNEYALDAVCADIQKQSIDKILVLGDLITDFSQATNTVLNKVRDLTDFVIRGNREGYLLSQKNGEFGDSWHTYHQFSTNLKTYQTLSDDDLKYIEKLPEQMSITIDDDFSARMVHGSPFSAFDTILEGKDELIARSFDSIHENILLCGHTHRPLMKELNGKTLVNAGSVGLNFGKNNSAQYALITFENGMIEVEMKKVPYNFGSFKNTCDLTDFWVLLCIKSMEDGVNYNMQFLEEAQAICGCFPVPNDVWDSLAKVWKEKGIYE